MSESTGEVVRATLMADPAVSALVGARIYPMRLPQSITLPAVVFGEVSNVPQNTFDNDADALTATRLQLDVYAKDYGDAAAAASAIEAALLRPGLTAWREVSRDLFDNELQLHRRSMDFTVWR